MRSLVAEERQWCHGIFFTSGRPLGGSWVAQRLSRPPSPHTLYASRASRSRNLAPTRATTARTDMWAGGDKHGGIVWHVRRPSSSLALVASQASSHPGLHGTRLTPTIRTDGVPCQHASSRLLRTLSSCTEYAVVSVVSVRHRCRSLYPFLFRLVRISQTPWL